MASPVPFSRRLREGFAAVLAVPVAAIALLTAQGVTSVAEAALGLEARSVMLASLAERSPARVGSPAFHATSASSILARNPFDSTARLRPAPPTDSSAEADDSDPRLAPECDGVHTRVIVTSADVDFSFAALEAPPRSVLRRRGGEVGARTIELISWDRVWLRDGDRLCQAPIFAPAPRGDPPARVSAHDGVATTPPPLDPTIARGIERVSATEFRVDRGIVPRILELQNDLQKPRMSVERGGKTTGVRLTGVAPGSLLGALGVQSGDLLQRVNGVDVNDTASLLQLYSRLTTLERLTAEVDRGGQPVRLDYDIR